MSFLLQNSGLQKSGDRADKEGGNQRDRDRAKALEKTYVNYPLRLCIMFGYTAIHRFADSI
jgi:hypothetical protein